jgi:hypothetical protein
MQVPSEVRLARVKSQASWFDRGCRAVSEEARRRRAPHHEGLAYFMENPSRGARVGARLKG